MDSFSRRANKPLGGKEAELSKNLIIETSADFLIISAQEQKKKFYQKFFRVENNIFDEDIKFAAAWRNNTQHSNIV